MSKGNVKSLYVHVPFCVAKCRYCDFFSVRYREEIVARYLEAIDRELASCIDVLDTVQTIYIGGGTPSVLEGHELRRLTGIIAGHVIRAADCEYTIEANPATLSDEKLRILKEAGINRISLGVQSFADRELSLLGRVHDGRQAEDAIRLVSGHFKNYSIDLIYGIPGQDEKGWIDTLMKALEFAPPHISAYELTPEKNTPLFEDLSAGSLEMVFEDIVVQMYEICFRIMKERGYEHYEISNYSIPGLRSRHNWNYWQRGEYLGIGPAAHSFVGGVRKNNVANVEWYCELLESGSAPVERSQQVAEPEAVREEIFLGLRTSEGINIRKIIERSHVFPGIPSDLMVKLENDLRPYIALNHVSLDEKRLIMTDKGFSLSNAIIIVILQALGL